RSQTGAGTCLGQPVDDLEARIITITDLPIAQWHEDLKITDGVGEIIVSGPNVSPRYYWPEEANALGKIIDNDRIWHRTGDLGWIDDQGRIWFCGRKTQRLETTSGPMYTVQVEQTFNTVVGVTRTALVGIGTFGSQQPVLCVEASPDKNQTAILEALQEHGSRFSHTADVDTFLFHPSFPVDIRHNAKIGREQLAIWANKKVKGAN
ncbi:MAG: fatty acid CoA ligase family protein, partial [Mycobacteriaceae bacterium]